MAERKILFKGFRPNKKGSTTIKLNGEKIRGVWVEGDLLTNGVDYECAIRINAGNEYGQIVAVLPETVGQWVKTDKNGKDVFVGDNVKTKYGRICEVIWLDNDENKCFDLIPIKNIHDGGNAPDLWDLWKQIELIGNKWESEVTE